MGFDALLKRYFPAVVCLLVAVAAYFQASGMGHLVASSVAPDPGELGAPPARQAPVAPAAPSSELHSTSGAAILARNAFDSVTGPLDGRVADTPAEAAPENSADPYADPECDSAKVLLITASDDPTWSFAAFADSSGKSILRRQGDDVAGATVHYIGWDRVWLMQGGSRCQAVVGGKGVVAKAPATPAVDPAAARKGASKVPAELASKIKKVGEGKFEVERSAVDYIIDNQADFMKSARIAPVRQGGQVVGVRLANIKSGTLLQMLGMQTGDVLKSINGFEMTDPQKALEAYARLRTADRLVLAVQRGGKDQTIEFNIK